MIATKTKIHTGDTRTTHTKRTASIAQKRHYFDTKKQEAYLNLLMCIDTRGSATLNTLVESKDSFKELMTALRDTYTTKEPAKVPLLLSKMSEGY